MEIEAEEGGMDRQAVLWFSKKTVYVQISLLFICLLVCYTVSCHGQERGMLNHAADELRAFISLDKESYAVNERIPVRCRIQNVSSHAMKLLVLIDDVEFLIRRADEQKLLRLESSFFIEQRPEEDDVIRLESGQFHSFTRLLTKKAYFAMPTKPGRYELYFVYDNKSSSLGRHQLWTGTVQSNTVSFTIEEDQGDRPLN